MINLNSFIGCFFFYADEETGIGWESRIDEISRSWDTDSVFLDLSCGTRVKVSGRDYLIQNYRAFRTNLKENNNG